jgi:hypothetical protein
MMGGYDEGINQWFMGLGKNGLELDFLVYVAGESGLMVLSRWQVER